MDDTIDLGTAKADVFYICEKCGTENHPQITNEMAENNETITVECSNCKHPKEINSKQLIDQIKKEAFEAVKKEFSKLF